MRANDIAVTVHINEDTEDSLKEEYDKKDNVFYIVTPAAGERENLTLKIENGTEEELQYEITVAGTNQVVHSAVIDDLSGTFLDHITSSTGKKKKTFFDPT